MNGQRKIIRQKLITSLVLIALILSSYGTFLSETVAAAINYENQKTATSDKKVSFDAYFLNGDAKTHDVIANTKDENELKLDISLEEGVMQNTKIVFNNPNFKINFEKLKENPIIKSVNEEENSIELNQIIENTVIPVSISYKEDAEMSLDDISRNTDISLTSIYTSTKDTDKEINGSISLNISWTSTIEGKIESNINNYSEIAGKSILITNYKSVMNNVNLPMESTNFELNVPEIEGQIPDEVKVIENGKEISNEEYTYDKENKRVNIIKSNVANEENKVRQMSGNMEYVVIYTYNKELKLKKVNTILNSNLKLKAYTLEEVFINNSQEVEKEKNNVTTNLNINTEAKISKGYLYNKENYEMPYSVNLEAQIQYIIPNSDIEIVENGETLLGDNVNINVSSIAEYKNTTINKDELVNILGENGVLEIINADTNKVLTRINKDTEADEKGNIVIKYKDIHRVRFLIKAPEQIGTINIKSNKKISKNNNISIDTLKRVNKLKISFENKNIAVSNTVEKDIELYNTVTKSDMEVSKTEFSTLDDNANMNIKLNLLTNNMDYDLYKNPKLAITFPSEFENITINSVGISFENGLKILNKRVSTNNDGTKTLYIDLEGEQKTYQGNNDVTANTQIVVDANVKINRTVTTREVDLRYNYTNEKAISFDDNGTQIAKIKINAPYGLVMSTDVNGNEGRTKEIKDVEIQARSEEQIVRVEENIVNNYNSDVNNFEITGVIPLKDKEYTLGDNTITSNYTATIDGNIEINRNDATIEFSEDNKNWTTTRSENSDLFRIKFNNSTLKKGDLITLSYNLKIPENVTYSKDGYVAFITNGQNENNNVNAWSAAKLSTQDAVMGETEPVTSTTEEGPIKTEISVMQGNESLQEGQVVYDEQVLKYIIKLTNTTDKPITNVKVIAKNTNAVFYEWVVEKFDEVQGNQSFKENPNKKEEVIDISEIKPGETKEVSYQTVAKKDGDDSIVKSDVSISADNITSQSMSSIENTIVDAKLKVVSDPGVTIGYPDEVREGGPVYVAAKITNLSDDKLNNIKINQYFGNYIDTDITGVSIGLGENIEEENRIADMKMENKVLSYTITEIEPSETIVITIYGILKTIEKDTTFYTYTMADYDDETYISNQTEYKIKKYFSDLEMNLTSNISEDTELKDGDNLIYTATIKNIGGFDQSLSVSDNVPEIAEINSVYYEKNGEKEEVKHDIDNSFSFSTNLGVNESITLVIDTSIYVYRGEEEEIENYISANATNLASLKTSNALKHKIYRDIGPIDPEDPTDPEEPTDPTDPEDPTDPTDPTDPEEPTDPEDPNNPNPPTETENHSIRGKVWLDSDKDGIKDDTETGVSNISLRLINSNGVELKFTTSSSNGTYEFTNVENGTYRVLLEYDNNSYGLTTYKKEGVSSNKDSDFIKSNVIEEGEQKELAATETITVSDNDITDIDAGLIKFGKHELVITKTLGEVTVKTKSSTKKYDLSGKQIAKVEIASKQMPNAEIIIEYNIKIQNNGEMDEYITNIRDIPSEGELADKNGDWSVEGENLINSELSKNPIKAGTSKEIKLRLKTKIDSNGTAKTINNKVDITENTNEDNITNINKDKASAQLLIGIKTGGMYIAISAVVIIILLIITAIIIQRKRGGK